MATVELSIDEVEKLYLFYRPCRTENRNIKPQTEI